MLTQQQLDVFFTYQKPAEDQVQRMIDIRNAAKSLAALILEYTPHCGDQLIAIQRVREAVMMANAAIVCHENRDEMKGAMTLNDELEPVRQELKKKLDELTVQAAVHKIDLIAEIDKEKLKNM